VLFFFWTFRSGCKLILEKLFYKLTMNVAIIFVALFAIPSVHSAPSPANYFAWLRTFNLQGSTNVAANGAGDGAPASCLPNVEPSPIKLAATLKADPTTSYFISSQMTKDRCSNHCAVKFGVPIVYALFDGNKCFCLPQTSKAWNHFSSNENVGVCNSRCAGKNTAFCGGSSSTFVSFA
jgi:hypothetical protein